MKKIIVLALVLSLPAIRAGLAQTDTQAKLASLASQLERIETELRNLTGGTQGFEVQLQNVKQGIESRYRDLEMRINTVEDEIQLFRKDLKRAIAQINPKLFQEQQQLQIGLDLVQKGEYKKAIASFLQFTKKYPKSPDKEEALFLIGEAHFSLTEYSQAVKDYQAFVEAFPKSPKAPQAILKQGESFLKLEMKTEAKAFWKKLLQEYPHSQEANQARAKIAALEQNPVATPAPAPTSATEPLPPAEAEESDEAVDATKKPGKWEDY